MKTSDLVSSAVSNTFRSKSRSILTILAIFVGAFTLTLTSGFGTGINAYIANTLSAAGASDTLTVTKPQTVESNSVTEDSAGPTVYNPDSLRVEGPGDDVLALTPDDVEKIEAVEGITDVAVSRSVMINYIQTDGEKYTAVAESMLRGQTSLVVAGEEPDRSSSAHQVAIPANYVESLGYSSNEDAIGGEVTIGLTDAVNGEHVVEATIAGVTELTLVSPTGGTVLVNDSLGDSLFAAQVTGLDPALADRYLSATVWFDAASTEAEITALKERLVDAGFVGETVGDQIGLITSIIDAVVLTLNVFAIIALLAASFGIVNTLFMSVKERTREIGLMKAVGMGSGRVFSLFSLEAVSLGFLGSALGIAVAMVVGTVMSGILGGGLLSGLNGLTLVAFDPLAVATIVLIVVGIAFAAGTLPAMRAARADPVSSLRYE